MSAGPACACRVIKAQNFYLVVCSVVHLAAAVLLVRLWGTIGLIAADCGNMCIRIRICEDFLGQHFRGVPGYSPRRLMLNEWTGRALCAAFLVTLASNAAFLGWAGAPALLAFAPPHAGSMRGWRFWACASAHAAVGATCLAAVLGCIWRSERSLLDEIKLLRRQG